MSTTNLSKNDIRGSIWRKWDLHIHTPETKKNNQYVVKKGDPWDLYCDKIEKSDVKAFGITDYFSASNYFILIDKYVKKYPSTTKVFFPNNELCTSDIVNKEQEEVNLHLIFNPDIPNLKNKLTEFLSNLKTNKTNDLNRNIKASELKNDKDFEEATTTRKFILDAFKETFGDKLGITDYLLIITAANHDGIRIETEKINGKTRGKLKKTVISHELDKFSHGFFGNVKNIKHYSNEDRLGSGEKTILKPVLSGSDSHSFSDLDQYLGKKVLNADGNIEKDVTWIKGNLTFEGLKQIIYEPINGERVFIGEIPPDEKTPDHVINKLIFSNTADFPKEIQFNGNLNSIIGSRSSGKSALLSYLAYAIDPEMAKQIKPDGPAANIKWDDIKFQVSVEWNENIKQQGKIVYIPQNYLYSLSNKPDMITSMIIPVLFEKHLEIKQTYERLQIDIKDTFNKAIVENIYNWFIVKEEIEVLKNTIKEIGDKASVNNLISYYEKKIDELKKIASLDDNEIKSYKDISQKIHIKNDRLEKIKQEKRELQSFICTDSKSNKTKSIDITTKLSFSPSVETLPDELKKDIFLNVSIWSSKISNEVQEKILAYKEALGKEEKQINLEISNIFKNNQTLIEKCKKNEILQDLIEKLDKQKAKKNELEKNENKMVEKNKELTNISDKVKDIIVRRKSKFKELESQFKKLDQRKDKIRFGVEIQFDPNKIDELSSKFNRKENSVYIDKKNDLLMIDLIRDNPSNFLESIYCKKQKVLQNENCQRCALDAFLFNEDIRFNATMENDSIGGFKVSSMTEGKQALFALTLLLDRVSDAWPLLIDQPEDDLDSRSMYSHIVPYLKEQKKRRQIIMVSHNANLVIGADSEQIIVANQNGIDRINKSDQKFDYFTGALEYSKKRDEKEKLILFSRGIREHACDILDGGELAFKQRKNKYNIKSN